jgi:hypothetical protein
VAVLRHWRFLTVSCCAALLSVGHAVVRGQAVPAAQPSRPALVVVVSVDGLSWPTLMRYRTWYTSGLKRLLDEGYSYTATNYQHINTETSPGHASLATGAPPRVTGIVANRWLTMGPDGAIRSVYSTQMFVPPPAPGDPPLFYREVPRDDRLYVFALSHEHDQWQSSGETGRAITRLGEGPQGQTVVFDSEDAIALFNQKNGRPAEPLPARATLTGPGNLRVDTIGDWLVAGHPESRVVSVSAKDRTAIMLAGRNPRHIVYWFDQDTGRFVTSPRGRDRSQLDRAVQPGAGRGDPADQIRDCVATAPKPLVGDGVRGIDTTAAGGWDGRVPGADQRSGFPPRLDVWSARLLHGVLQQPVLRHPGDGLGD